MTAGRLSIINCKHKFCQKGNLLNERYFTSNHL